MNAFILFGINITAILLLSALVRKFAEGAFPSKIFIIFVFPGIVLHEVFHAMASASVGGKIHGIKLFSLSGGSVLHERPKIPFGQFFISFAPFIGGVAVIILWGFMVFGQIRFTGVFDGIERFWNIAAHVSSLWLWVSVYILYSVSATMLPSSQDVKNTAVGLAASFFAGGILLWASPVSVPLEFFEKANAMFTAYVLPILLFFTLVSSACFFLRKVVR